MKITMKIDGQTKQFGTKLEASTFLHARIYETFDIKKQHKYSCLLQQLKQGKTLLTDEI